LGLELRRLGVSHIIAHANALNDAGRAWLERGMAHNEIGFVRRFDAGLYGDWLFAIGSPQRRAPELEAMLRGEPTYSENTFGMLDYPRAGEVLTDRAFISGWALSPFGIQSVNLLFNNGAIRFPTELRPDPGLKTQFRWYDATPRPRYEAAFSKRPRGVWRNTDIQVEIIDGRGKRTLLEDRWVVWP
jgi:hypothetical protein